MGSFALSIYSDLLTSLHCSVCKTGVILAKPITILAILDYIDKELTAPWGELPTESGERGSTQHNERRRKYADFNCRGRSKAAQKPCAYI